MLKNKLFYLLFFVFVTVSVVAQESFVISSGSAITTSGASTITLHNLKLTNNGALTDVAGTIQFTGNASASNSSLEGTGTTVLNNLIINKASNNVQLDKNITVNGNINLSSGGLSLNNGSINLTTTGQINNENETNNISGTGGNIVVNKNLNAPSNENPGNLGAIISSASNLGMTSIVRSHTQQTTIEGASILRTYKITPTNNTGLDATIAFSYLDQELNNNAEASLYIWESTDNGTTWVQKGSTLNTNNTLTLTGIDALTQYTARSASPLHVEEVKRPDTFSLYKVQEQLRFNSNLVIQNIAIYDIAGKRIYKQDKINKSMHQIQLYDVDRQVLIVNTQFANGVLITKKILF